MIICAIHNMDMRECGCHKAAEEKPKLKQPTPITYGYPRFHIVMDTSIGRVVTPEIIIRPNMTKSEFKIAFKEVGNILWNQIKKAREVEADAKKSKSAKQQAEKSDL